MNQTTFRREWAMPSADTFDVPPIGEFVKRYIKRSTVSIDPFARNKTWATYTNDLNPTTTAQEHKDAREFMASLVERSIKADLIIFDPPYSPRQVAEVYGSIGKKPTMQDTQTARLKRECRDLIRQLCDPGSVVLSFGWNTVGMGPRFQTEEVLLVCHGGDHNDTICMAQRCCTAQTEIVYEPDHL
jgi:hypothetical protein